MKQYRINAIAAGALFIITMGLGMYDAYSVEPRLAVSLGEILTFDSLILQGAFAVFAMAIGIVGIALALYPVVKRQSETIAIAYVSFRIIECILLLIGPLVYLFLITAAKTGGEYMSSELITLAAQTKNAGYQLAMIILGFGSLFLCYSFYRSKAIPRFLSIWGFIGYTLLLLSAVLDLSGTIDTTGSGIILYIPGGLWEIIGFPLWMFTKGFK